MALQDLTPQLRTRLSRVERAVGWFVLLAMAVLVFGFGYYLYNTAETKGWFKIKARYFTYTDRATGLKQGDPVQLMGFNVGQITLIEGLDPGDPHNVYVEFDLKEPYYGYLWTEGSVARINSADLLGKRVLEVTKGTGGYATYLFNPLREVTLDEARALPDPSNWALAQEILQGTNVVIKARAPLTKLEVIAALGYTNLAIMNPTQTRKSITGVWRPEAHRYALYTKATPPYMLEAEESAAVTERLEHLVGQIETALPNILALTNQLSTVLSNSASLTSNLNFVAVSVRPVVSNLSLATANLNRPGALGEWLLPTNLNHQIETTLGSADATLSTAHAALSTANTNLAVLMQNLGRTLDNLSEITGDLNRQVATNTNLVKSLSDTIIHADDFIQGLKHHWLLRSAFKTPEPPSPPSSRPPLMSPKEKGGL